MSNITELRPSPAAHSFLDEVTANMKNFCTSGGIAFSVKLSAGTIFNIEQMGDMDLYTERRHVVNAIAKATDFIGRLANAGDFNLLSDIVKIDYTKVEEHHIELTASLLGPSDDPIVSFDVVIASRSKSDYEAEEPSKLPRLNCLEGLGAKTHPTCNDHMVKAYESYFYTPSLMIIGTPGELNEREYGFTVSNVLIPSHYTVEVTARAKL